MVSYEGLADEYLWVPQSKCCSKPEKVQNILIHPVSGMEKQQQMKEVFLLVLQTLYQFALQLLDFGMPDVDSESSLLLLLELQSQGV